MRALALALLVGAGAGSSATADEFPYTAYVTADEAYYRSGPGSSYYPCGRLRRGATVEVWREDAGGWCAIRPPKDAFSWVAARDLSSVERGLAAARRDDVPVRVGSLLRDVRDAEQVRLRKGEQVALADAEPVCDAEGTPLWQKIAPPAGEFRWVSARFLSRDRIAETPTHGSDSHSSSAHDGGSTAARADDVEADEESSDEQDDDSQAGAETDAAVWQLAALEAELARALAADAAEWDLDPLADEADALLEQLDSADDRQAVRHFIKKLDRLRKLQRRVAKLEPGEGSDDDEGDGAVEEDDDETGDEDVAEVESDDDDTPRYDGSGRLARVVSRRVGDPQFALIDDDGEVRGYVTAAPGVNLRRFVGQRVGILGQRGYLPNLQAEHVTARQVAPLDETRRR
jgi:uncharacterized protein YgiM (DUF1202 family)